MDRGRTKPAFDAPAPFFTTSHQGPALPYTASKPPSSFPLPYSESKTTTDATISLET